MKSVQFCKVCVWVFLSLGALRGDELNLGYVSFDTLIPGVPGFPGVNSFTIGNLTGDPGAGGFALPPDFPSFTGAVFRNSSLTLNIGNSPTVMALGDIGPGFFSPPSLEFADTIEFSSARFTASLDSPDFLLSGGSTFTANSLLIDVLLSPAAGNALAPGIDVTLITVSDAVTPIPEPASWILLVSAGVIPFIRKALVTKP